MVGEETEDNEDQDEEKEDIDISSDQFKENVLAALKIKIANHNYQKKCVNYHKVAEKAHDKWALGTAYFILVKVYKKLKR